MYKNRRYNVKSIDDEWVEKERLRGREKYKRLNYKGKYIKFYHKNVTYRNINRRLKNLGYDMKDKEAHHWNYNLGSYIPPDPKPGGYNLCL